MYVAKKGRWLATVIISGILLFLTVTLILFAQDNFPFKNSLCLHGGPLLCKTFLPCHHAYLSVYMHIHVAINSCACYFDKTP